REFGGVEQTKESYREQAGFPFAEGFARDMRLGARALRKSAGFTFSAGFTLALGVGGFSAIFSIAEWILWKPLPSPESERLVTIYSKSAAKSARLDLLTVPEYLEWKSKNATLQEFAAFRWTEEHVLKAGGKLERVRVAPITKDF